MTTTRSLTRSPTLPAYQRSPSQVKLYRTATTNKLGSFGAKCIVNLCVNIHVNTNVNLNCKCLRQPSRTRQVQFAELLQSVKMFIMKYLARFGSPAAVTDCKITQTLLARPPSQTLIASKAHGPTKPSTDKSALTHKTFTLCRMRGQRDAANLHTTNKFLNFVVYLDLFVGVSCTKLKCFGLAIFGKIFNQTKPWPP